MLHNIAKYGGYWNGSIVASRAWTIHGRNERRYKSVNTGDYSVAQILRTVAGISSGLPASFMSRWHSALRTSLFLNANLAHRRLVLRCSTASIGAWIVSKKMCKELSLRRMSHCSSRFNQWSRGWQKQGSEIYATVRLRRELFANNTVEASLL